MANFNEGRAITRIAGADLTDKEYYIVKQSASDRSISLCSAGTDFSVGVLQAGATTGGNVSIVARNAEGTFKVIAGAAITAGTFLTSDSAGKAVSTTSSGDELIGIAMEAASGAGQIIEYMPLARKY